MPYEEDRGLWLIAYERKHSDHSVSRDVTWHHGTEEEATHIVRNMRKAYLIPFDIESQDFVIEVDNEIK